jgi:hypothetical protein
VLEAEKLPAGVTHLATALADHDAEALTHVGGVVELVERRTLVVLARRLVADCEGPCKRLLFGDFKRPPFPQKTPGARFRCKK